VTDAISDVLWTPSPDADENLRREGVPGERIKRVGNIMIDSLVMMQQRIEQAETASRFGVTAGCYAVATLHRPVNVDSEKALSVVLNALSEVARRLPVVFPMHPRTRARLEQFALGPLLDKTDNIVVCPPLGYLEFMNLLSHSALAITDSGGIQEESCYLGIPCLTVRESTERPATVTSGANRLTTLSALPGEVEQVLSKGLRGAALRVIPELWDGQTASRIVQSLRQHLK
jgi:UDP-N-acetylglucosamine 2-epimerase (non-hydrolysing)